MAGTDYYSCDVCERKTFYDSNLDYGGDHDGWTDLPRGAGAMAVLCEGCAKTHKIKITKKRIDWDSQPLGETSDAELAERLGVSRQAVHHARNRRAIVAYDLYRGVDWSLSNKEIAHLLGVAPSSVYSARSKRGIEPVPRPRRPLKSRRRVVRASDGSPKVVLHLARWGCVVGDFVWVTSESERIYITREQSAQARKTKVHARTTTTAQVPGCTVPLRRLSKVGDYINVAYDKDRITITLHDGDSDG